METGEVDAHTWPMRCAEPVRNVALGCDHALLYSGRRSGRSAFSAAGAEILRLFTGSDAFGASVTLPVGSSKIESGLTPSTPVTLHWNTFTDAADQAGISRRYGGIHFKAGDLTGRAAGRIVAYEAWIKAEALWNGRR